MAASPVGVRGLGRHADPSRRGLCNARWQAHPDLAVTFNYTAYASHAVFRSGTVPHGAHTATIDLHNGWTVRSYGLVATPGLFGNGAAVAVLLAGIAASLLLAAFLLVLATGRSRALELVHEKTDELRHKALHDSLTGLPNRALIMDRVEHLMARNLRSDKLAAALYVDLDGFKNVNDTLGHGAGDRLLEAVAAAPERQLARRGHDRPHGRRRVRRPAR